MSKKKMSFVVALTGSLLFVASSAYAFGDFGTDVNTACAPARPYTGSCALCHTGGYSAPTPGKTAY
ncbi:MAG: hypothetical protein HY789_06355, partial [Deltaproteobacteria bacterium]|nr:hypothetical protein [Deltaproteobacteria bacterium]